MNEIREQIEQLRHVAVLTEAKATHMFEEAADTMEKLLVALEKLARLGNEPHYGNSDGNMIARKAIDAVQTRQHHPECDREAMCDICHPEDTVDSRQPSGAPPGQPDEWGDQEPVGEKQCLDCKKYIEEAELVNASLDPNEFNPACPYCGSDNIRGTIDDGKVNAKNERP